MASAEDSALHENLCNKKKKKKKMKIKEHEMTEDNVVQPMTKHKKRKRGDGNEKPEILKEENVEDCKPNDNDCDGHKKKTKGKESKSEDDNLIPSVTKKKKKNKHKEKGIREEPEDTHVSEGGESEKKQKKKKKKQKEKEITEEPEDVHVSEDGESKKKQKKKKKSKESKDPVTDNVDIATNEKSKHRKKKRRSGGSDNEKNISNGDENSLSSCKKSKSSNSLMETVNVDEKESDCVKKKKKKRKHSLEVQETIQDTEKSPKKPKKDSKLNGEFDLAPDSNLTSDKNINVPSGQKQNAAEPIVGQWGTSSLGSDTRQQKFLRLMGGFKKATNDTNSSGSKKSKGLFGSLKPTPAATNLASQGGNRAMDASQEKNYLMNMEKDYERAMSMNLNRGIGLGFEKPPGEGKKFYIDTKASKSIKFDD